MDFPGNFTFPRCPCGCDELELGRISRIAPAVALRSADLRGQGWVPVARWVTIAGRPGVDVVTYAQGPAAVFVRWASEGGSVVAHAGSLWAPGWAWTLREVCFLLEGRNLAGPRSHHLLRYLLHFGRHPGEVRALEAVMALAADPDLVVASLLAATPLKTPCP